MTSRWLRGTVFAALIVVLALAALMVLRAERRTRATAEVAQAVEQASRRAVSAAYDVRASQQGYVAFAQSPEWWHGRLASHVEALRADLGTLRQLATDGSALNDLDAAAASLDAFAQVDERALRMVLAGRNADASLLVFSEGLETISTVVQRIESARTAESMAAATRVAVARLTQAYAAATAMATAVLVALLLLVPARSRARAAGEDTDAPGAAVAQPPQAAEAPVVEEPGAGVPAADDSTPPLVDRRQATELHAAASLCTDFARVVDPHELPGLLARTADLLEAKGVIVWMADADGSVLRPSLAHGYSAAALARLSALHRDADNATAACFRRAELDAVAGGDAPGAIVAPLLTASGCVGVLAAEVLNGREASEPTRAMTRILAAQISTLVGGGPAREEIAPDQAQVG